MMSHKRLWRNRDAIQSWHRPPALFPKISTRPAMVRRRPAPVFERRQVARLDASGDCSESTVKASKKTAPFALQHGPDVASALTTAPVPSDVD
jgi:hypothetical protein